MNITLSFSSHLSSTHTLSRDDLSIFSLGRNTLKLSWDYRLVRSMWLVGLCSLVYDSFLTFDEEVRYFLWGRRGFIQWLYFGNRYFPLACLIIDNVVITWPNSTVSLCAHWYKFFTYSILPLHLSIGGILIMRIYALYNLNRKLLAFLLIVLLGQCASETTVLSLAGRSVTVHPTGCLPTTLPPKIWVYWIPMVFFQSILFLLSVYKIMEPVSKGGLQSSQFNLRGHGDRVSHLRLVILRDSVVYFGGTLFVISANLLVWALARPSIFTVGAGSGICLHSVLGCRMLLNIRKEVDIDRSSQKNEMEAAVMLELQPMGA